MKEVQMTSLIKAYNEHYMNCYLNNLFSIVCSKNSELKLLSYNNDFNYTIQSHNKFRYLQFDYSDNFYLLIYKLIFGNNAFTQFDIFSLPLGVESKVKSENLNEINMHLSNGNVVFLLIDLYDLNNGNIFYKKMHRNHYLLIIGYDYISKEYITLDEGNKGYCEYRICIDDIKILMNNAEKKVYYCTLSSIGNCLPKDIVSIEKIKNNAIRIKNQLMFILDSFSILTKPVNYNEYCYLLIFIQRCFNRHVSNKHLINHIRKEIITNTLEKIIEQNRVLISGWYNLRARLLKNSALGLEMPYELIFDKMKKLIYDEIIFWDSLKSSI